MKKHLNEPLICEDYIRYIDWDYEEFSDMDDFIFEETNYPKKSNSCFKKYFCCWFCC
jgi:hypothetical protein